MPVRSSEWTSVKRDASSASCAAYASRPTLVAVNAPPPATTKEPDITLSPGFFSTGSASPVSSDSSISSPSASRISPSTTHLSPGPSSMVSPRTISPVGMATAVPSRRTVGLDSPMTARLSRVFLARSSWMMPIAVLATITNPKRPSWMGPTTRMIRKRTPMMALKRVKTLARTISAVEREDRTGTSLTSPRETRSATCAVVSPGCADGGTGSSTAVCAGSVMSTTVRAARPVHPLDIRVRGRGRGLINRPTGGSVPLSAPPAFEDAQGRPNPASPAFEDAPGRPNPARPAIEDAPG